MKDTLAPRMRVVLVAVFVLAVVTVLAGAGRRYVRLSGQRCCQSQMNQLYLAAKAWSSDHDGQWPTNILQLTNEFSVSAVQLRCLGDTDSSRWTNRTDYFGSYRVVVPKASTEDGTDVLEVQCVVHGLYRFATVSNGMFSCELLHK